MTEFRTVNTGTGAQIERVTAGDLVEIFAGYDFMGSVNWTTDRAAADTMSPEEAEQIKADLIAAE